LMRDFTASIGLKSKLEEWKIDPDQNFENIFSDLHEKKEIKKINEIEEVVEEFFNQLELPDRPTIYDHLVLSLRKKDLIATFNWDPLLMAAHCRNKESGLELPQLAFLHGNVSTGYCEKHNKAGLAGRNCSECDEVFTRTPLLYPIKKKDYAKNPFIQDEWVRLKNELRNAFWITIFGYSGPQTDTEAISAMKEAWGDTKERAMEESEFITTRNKDEIEKNWNMFIHSHHFEVHPNFYDSWIANHPRRTNEAYIDQFLGAEFIDDNPIPQEMDFADLWRWYEQIQ